jgi:3-hydroxyisobutyrate dehydrogenase
MRVAVLGTGTMGTGMAHSMQRAGLQVTAWNRTAERARPLAGDGIVVAASVAEAVRGADVVVTMLFDADAVLSITDQLVDSLDDDAVWLQSSTVGPEGTERIATAAGDAPLVDAPVLGTKDPAEKGTLTVVVSGPPDLIDKARPVLDAIGSKTVVAGERVGPASALKLAGNAWIATLTAGTAQSLALAEALGVTPSLFLDAIRDTPSDSPYAQSKGSAMIAGDFAPSFAVKGLLKDLDLMLAAASTTAFADELLRGLERLYRREADTGHADDDVAAVRLEFTRDR